MDFALVAARVRQQSLASNTIYMDCAATTPLDPRVAEVMTQVLCDRTLGNASAKHHRFGAAANDLVKAARENVARAVGCRGDEIVFTSGATEGNNLILKALAKYLQQIGKTHIIASAVEHKSVLAVLEQLAEQGFSITVLPVKPCGMLEANMVLAAMKPETGLLSVQAVNNELGTIQPLSEISAAIAGRDVLFHTDAAQALGKIKFDVNACGVDFATFSAHKVNGPQGVGAVYVKASRIEYLTPLIAGGGQESGLRSGTTPTALCAGFGAACSILESRRDYVQLLRDRLLSRLAVLKPTIYGHKFPEWNAPGIVSSRFPGIDTETLVMALPGLAFGIGAACSRTGSLRSHVIKAITGSDEAASETIRLSFDRYTTVEDIDACSEQIIGAVTNIRQLEGVGSARIR